ncbi:hypothetical protein HMPREF1391_01485 [Helicobacter pylori GAM100Ai]|uniref:Uncharacterized protein n=1 Tax=Helicobacter pylori GAM100Ai TaxID=1159019 RepID=A0AB72ZSZ2_HELPX|nr:hypothetical protein HMPREF1391_01485 [Helicobacter pylori GAM100Ai]
MKNFFQTSGFNENPLAFLIFINGIPIAKSKKTLKAFFNPNIKELDFNQAIAFQDLF